MRGECGQQNNPIRHDMLRESLNASVIPLSVLTSSSSASASSSTGNTGHVSSVSSSTTTSTTASPSDQASVQFDIDAPPFFSAAGGGFGCKQSTVEGFGCKQSE